MLSRLGVLSLALLPGCRFLYLERNLDELAQDYGRIVVDFEATTESDAPKIIALIRDVSDEEVSLRAHVAYESKRVSWICDPGEYYVGAYEDRNRDFQYERGEPGRFYGEPTRLTVTAGKEIEIQLRLTEEDVAPRASALELVQHVREAHPTDAVSATGEVTTLADPRFDAEKGVKGMWRPNEFLRAGILGLYLLEPFDPDRTPVVFVHGIGGTPRNFETLIAELDREKFQPWVYAYPSGLGLDGIAAYLSDSLTVMRAEFGTEKLALVAHSMGGLVARRAALNMVREGNHEGLEILLTIASPFGGVASADTGTRWATTVMPCWYDLAPGSPFLGALFEETLKDVPHHVVFAFRNGGILAASGDGTIRLSSQLATPLQDQASSLVGVDADHTGVLKHADALRAVARSLAEYAAP